MTDDSTKGGRGPLSREEWLMARESEREEARRMGRRQGLVQEHYAATQVEMRRAFAAGHTVDSAVVLILDTVDPLSKQMIVTFGLTEPESGFLVAHVARKDLIAFAWPEGSPMPEQFSQTFSGNIFSVCCVTDGDAAHVGGGVVSDGSGGDA